MPENLGELLRGIRIRLGEAGVLPEFRPRIPLKEIDKTNVSKTIVTYLGNPIQEKIVGDRWANAFSIVTVLQNMGYSSFLRGKDYSREFGPEYKATRRVLATLVQQGVIMAVARDKPDENGEILYYKVVNEDLLKSNYIR